MHSAKDEFRWKVMGLVGLTLMGTFIWDRFCVLIFAPEIFKAVGPSDRAAFGLGMIQSQS